ncbi:hypothetical protein [Ahrensia sp. R2A130]|uniref:hypothetical protein n=1 Tax=Ahrensia sp. R2A130 TaxID=744979 RepID=UPI0001E0D8BF|nr:hypothetical protein [Ahrensia sp. R2A130]EFL87525.1 conserved hypothetical protein [Ahrensia sp. R2A130]
MSTVFRAEHVETNFAEATELAEFSGLKAEETVAFRLERLIVHELLVRVTADLSVPDGPEYEQLGLNLRGMVKRINERYVAPRIQQLATEHVDRIETAKTFIDSELLALRANTPPTASQTPESIFAKLAKTLRKKPKEAQGGPENFEEKLARAKQRWESFSEPDEAAFGHALILIVDAIMRTQGRLPADTSIASRLAINRVINTYCSERIGLFLDKCVAEAAAGEGYEILPAQTKPIVMNVKGASASGKSTIRPHQRELSRKLGISWRHFALISPDYWRKYLLDYETLGDDSKYGAMLTGHELVIIDAKLDRYMAYKAERGDMPHLLIDRFRFDSFSSGTTGSNLLTRFGHTVFMFFMVTPPAETVERAWKRGLTTGRFKAVDDLLDHNIEAYTGMPALFFAWALSDKRVHYEFLDNGVEENELPRTIAWGWNSHMTVLNVQGLLDIERFRNVNVEARSREEVFAAEELSEEAQMKFLLRCCEKLDDVKFVDPNLDTTALQTHLLKQSVEVQWKETDVHLKRPVHLNDRELEAVFPDCRIGSPRAT